ncbi:alpha/beta fold hydrolase [Nocardia brasiliensis]
MRRSVVVLALSMSVLCAAGQAAVRADTFGSEFDPPPARSVDYPRAAPRVPETFAAQSLDWRPCTQTTLGDAWQRGPSAALRAPLLDGLDCATVRTPLDWSRPDTSAVVTFRISRLPAHASAGGSRTLLTSPGGSGAGTLLNPLEWAAAFPELRDSYDLIGFEPRGTALSSTDQDCDRNVSGDPMLLANGRNDSIDVLDFSTESVRRQLGQARDWVRSCMERSTRTPAGETTIGAITYWQTVRDLDLARALLNAQTWSFLGVSQGTQLGLELARTFPARIDRLVLDSMVDPAVALADGYTERPLRQQKVLENHFAPWLAQRGTAFGSTGGDVLAALTTLRKDLTARPIPLPFGRTFSGNDLNMVFYGVDNSPYETLEGKLRILRTALDQPSVAAQAAVASTFAVSPLVDELAQDVLYSGLRVGWFTARNCNSAGWSHDLDEIVDAAKRLAERAPLTYIGLGFSAVCAFWPDPHTSTSPGGYDRIGSALLIGNEKDPVTTISGARAVRASIPDARLVTVVGRAGHLVLPQTRVGGLPGSIRGTSSCARALAAAYLLDGTLPAGDVACLPS